MAEMDRINSALRTVCETLPGFVAMATTANGTLYEGAFGVRDAGGKAPMTVDTVFALASMTKAVVSVAALQLVDEGRLALDDPIAEVLPELSAPQVLEGFGSGGEAQLRPARGPITLRQLLSHSAGYGYDTVNADLKRFLEASGLPTMPEDAEQLARFPLLFEPGTHWSYGINTDIVGKAIEAVSGQRLDQQMGQRLLAQLGMADSGFLLTSERRDRLAVTHSRDIHDRLIDIGYPFDRGARWCVGGGGMHGTAGDYLKFIRTILNEGMHEGTRVLSPKGMNAISRNQLGPGVAVRKMLSSDHSVALDAEFFPGMTKHWSAAFMINTERAPTGRNPGSLAWAGVANTFCWVDPIADIGGVFMTQIMPFYDPAAMAAFAAFERAVYDVIDGAGS